MHGGAAVVASAAFQETPRSTADDYIPADDNKVSTQQQAPPASSSSDNNDSRGRLEGKVAVITGGARGIGKAIARLFVARVVIADVVDDAAGEAAAALLGPPEWCSYERCDVLVEADVERAVRRTVARHERLDDVLCNAAGVLVGQQARGRSSSILALDTAEFESVVRMKHAAGAMITAGEGGGGSIVSVASVAGGMGPHASEHALVRLTENAACELGRHDIRVNCISTFGVHGAAADEQEEVATLKQQGAIDIAEARFS